MNRLLHLLLALCILCALALSLVGSIPVNAQGSATLNITLRGCPTGVNPQLGNPAADCTTPLDAPDDAGVFWGGDGQGGMPLSDVRRLHNGTYRVSVPATMPLSLFNFEPEVRDDFLAVGTTGVDPDGDPTISLAPGTTGQVTLYYYFFPEEETGATLAMTFRACPAEFDSSADDFFTDCTIPLDAPDAALILWGGDGQGGMEVTGLDRASNGTYLYAAGPHTMNLDLTGLEPTVRDGYQVFGFDSVNGDVYTFNLATGEHRDVVIFSFFE